ncbi:unnamed protein product [Cuscuta epithymum]|uniref:Uncharacterized protein n=1 Tax=Cuscuta epithymum TaxID=186058 RepID=A0AAV0GCY7_9ASTE|nr:unnamed protein product [Cuscuta epithymum]CAH9145449.1 unnamed protein product [Cuscuta epithymum]
MCHWHDHKQGFPGTFKGGERIRNGRREILRRRDMDRHNVAALFRRSRRRYMLRLVSAVRRRDSHVALRHGGSRRRLLRRKVPDSEGCLSCPLPLGLRLLFLR